MGFHDSTFSEFQAEALRAARPPSYPISEAALETAKSLGSVLLWPGDHEGNWRFGRWAGPYWANDDGEIINPSRYALLPEIPAS
jgi:hypothetical protein